MGRYKHGHAEQGISPTYHSWAGMKARCTNPNHQAWLDYGGRGITIDPRWENFANFLEDMGEKPKGLSLDRIDNDKGYFKQNCRWATREVQNTNQRMRKDNTSGLKGVSYNSYRMKWCSYFCKQGKTTFLYDGPSFWEACCTRKSWEAQNGNA